MDALLIGVNWTAVIIGAIVAFVVGSVWYSEKLFGRIWKRGIGEPVMNYGMLLPMLAQGVVTFVFAWIIGITAVNDNLLFALLITIAIAGFIKAQGLFAGKTKSAILVEVGYVFVMACILILAHAIF